MEKDNEVPRVTTGSFGSCFKGKTNCCANFLKATTKSKVLAILADGSIGDGKTADTLKELAEIVLTGIMKNAAVDDLFTVVDCEQRFSVISLSILLINNRQLYWTSAGVNRIYLFRQGILGRITREYIAADEVAMAVPCGKTDRTAEGNAGRNGLTNYLGNLGTGPNRRIDAAVRPFILQTGDLLLLCSNSFYAAMQDEEIKVVLDKSANTDDNFISNNLIKAAEQRVGKISDIAVTVVRVCEKSNISKELLLEDRTYIKENRQGDKGVINKLAPKILRILLIMLALAAIDYFTDNKLTTEALELPHLAPAKPLVEQRIKVERNISIKTGRARVKAKTNLSSPQKLSFKPNFGSEASGAKNLMRRGVN